MKETLHSSDGSQYYGNGVWGPSSIDLQRADLSFSEESKIRKEPSSNLLFVSQESIFGKFFQAISKTRLPVKFAIPVGLAVAVVAVACGSKNSEESKLPSTPMPYSTMPSQSGAPLNPKDTVVAGPKSPIPPISGNVNEKKAETLVKGAEKTKEEWKTFKSDNFPYEIKYPASWKRDPYFSRDTDVLETVADTPRDLSGALRVSYKIINPDITLEGLRKHAEQDAKNAKDSDVSKIIKTEKRKVAGFDAQTILFREAITEAYATFIVIEADEPRRLWVILYSYDSVQVPGPEAERINNQFLESFKPLPSASLEKKTEVGWTRFNSFDLPYQIDYPSNWRVDKNVVIDQFYANPSVVSNEVNPTKFRVEVEPAPSWITIDAYKNKVTESVRSANASITETPNQSINGQKAWRLDVLTTSSATTPYRSVIYITIKDGIAWILTYTADSSEFNQNLPTFEKMLDSFRFLK